MTDKALTDKERLVELMVQCFKECLQTKCTECKCFEIKTYDCRAALFAEYLIANGVVVQKQGEWERLTYVMGRAKCTNCESTWEIEKINAFDMDYCPNCGAKMVKEKDDAE